MTEKAPTEKPTSRLTSLAAALGRAADGAPGAPLPPVESWHPPDCGTIDMRIAADGTWFYEGTPIGRPALVALFARILRKTGDRYELVTPVERVGITVEDAPFVAVAMESAQIEGAPGHLRFVTNLGDEVEAGASHPLRFVLTAENGIKPYVHVRGDLWARLTRGLAIELMDHAIVESREGVPTLGVLSGGVFFVIGPTETLL